jgi:hypothetical protein
MNTTVPIDVDLSGVVTSVKQPENIKVEPTDSELITLE